MPNKLAEIENLKTSHFICDQMEIGEGCVKVVSVETIEQGNAFVDVLMGLSQPDSGRVMLLDQNIYEKSETARLALLADVGHVGGGLISNLKVWENLVLPACFHGRVDEAEAEKRLVSALEVIDNRGLWKENRLLALPDTLSALALRIASLLRCAVTRPKLIVGEFLLNDLESGPLERILKILEWLRLEDPKLGFLFIHLGQPPSGPFCLDKLGEFGMVTLKEGTHAISKND
jgi:predicted ABC-type transport system involved in lysophospholipase L1 biosynthesis ATPase subunit